MLITKEEFEEMVSKGIEAIPEKFLRKIDNVAIVIEEEPTGTQLAKLRLRPHALLFGLYEGVPITARSIHNSGQLPDKITIFMKPILAISRTKEDVARIARDTVWHEIAHHFGMDEGRVRRAEHARKHKNANN